MRNYNNDNFSNISTYKDSSTTNLRLIQNKIFNKSSIKNNRDISTENSNHHSMKKINRPLSTSINSNIKEFKLSNNKLTKEFAKNNINHNNNLIKNNIAFPLNINHILEGFNINNSSYRNCYRKINGKNLEEFIIKNIITFPKIKEINNIFTTKNSKSTFKINNNQGNNNVNHKNKFSEYPYFTENGKGKGKGKENNFNLNKNSILPIDQSSKILKYFIIKNNSKEDKKPMIKNGTFQYNNNIMNNKDNKYYNNTINSFLLKTTSNSKFLNSNNNNNNNSLLHSYPQALNSSLENKKQNIYINYKYFGPKEIPDYNKNNISNIKTIKSNDNFNFISKNNIKNNNETRTTNDLTQKSKIKEDSNTNYFLKEEFLEKINNIRKIYKEKEAKRQNLKCFYYLILPGNASYLIEKCMYHRINWMKPFSVVSTMFNFKWQELSYGIDYSSLGCFQNVNQIVNHYENHPVISNKAKMFTNLMSYCEKRNISAFKYVPFTIIFDLKEEKNKEENENEKNNNDNNQKNQNIKNFKYQILKDFINNTKKYVMKYDEIGNYFNKDNYKNFLKLKNKDKTESDKNINNKENKRYMFKKKYNLIKKNKKGNLSNTLEQKKENESVIEKNIPNFTFYTDFFNNLIEDNSVPIYDKNKENKYEQEHNLNTINKQIDKNNTEPNIIGANTIIEIPETHFSEKNIWVVKAINLNRGMCIRIVNSYEQMINIIEKFKHGVDYNFTKEKIDENEINSNKINNNESKDNKTNNLKKVDNKNINNKEEQIKNNVNLVEANKNVNANLNSNDKINSINKNLNSVDKTKIIKNLNSVDKIKNNQNLINNLNISEKNKIIKNNSVSFDKSKKRNNSEQNNKKTEENKKNIDKDEKIYNCSRIIIQKYIENPLLYKGRKCDMRIWVLITQSMKVYVFKEGHLKTCSIEYNIDSKDAFAHITNYSFQKYNRNFQKYEKGNEVPFYEFQKFLDEEYSEKKYNIKKDLLEQIKEIVKITMKSVKDKINKNNRNFQFEIFGYDFMMDKDFNLFLIEINTNPGLEESSPWIKIIVPRMLDDALRLTIDQLFETKYDFNVIEENKTKEEIDNYNRLLNNYNRHIDINRINVSCALNLNSSKDKINKDEIKENNIYLNTIPKSIKKEERDKSEIGEININKKIINESNNDGRIKDQKDNNNISKENTNKNKKYISPFPIPGYNLCENLWDFVCDLKEPEPVEELIEKDKDEDITKENSELKNNNYKFSFRKRKNKKGKKRKMKLMKRSKNKNIEKEDKK